MLLINVKRDFQLSRNCHTLVASNVKLKKRDNDRHQKRFSHFITISTHFTSRQMAIKHLLLSCQLISFRKKRKRKRKRTTCCMCRCVDILFCSCVYIFLFEVWSFETFRVFSWLYFCFSRSLKLQFSSLKVVDHRTVFDLHAFSCCPSLRVITNCCGWLRLKRPLCLFLLK
jgi:hypothetical protein